MIMGQAAVFDYNSRIPPDTSAMHIDLHTHTLASDGALSAVDLIKRALARGIEILAITDHDTVAAYAGISKNNMHLTLIPGIEFSTTWNNTGIHVVGLNIALNNDTLQEGIARQQNARRRRAAYIAERLEKLGIPDAYAGALGFAGNAAVIGRPHFAAYLVDIGAARTVTHAFDKFLKHRAFDSTRFWAPLPQIISWIRDAGGMAVLAHPLKYKFTRTGLSALIDDFLAAGGQGLEVISGRQNAQDTLELAQLCKRRQLLASCGSDFHQPDQPWAELGGIQPLPGDCRPVWECF